MVHRYTATQRVRIGDVDAWGEPSAQQLAALLEDCAWQASADAGFGDTWYRQQGVAWVIHRLTLARLGTIRHWDDLAVTTWISTLGRVRSSRDYEARNAEGDLVAVGRADWVFIDRATGRPKGIDKKIVDTFATGGYSQLLVVPPAAVALDPPGRPFTMAHQVYRYDTDSLGHVNNTSYLTWLDEALAASLAVAGLPLAAPAATGLRLRGIWYVVDYLRSALAGDRLTITSRLTGMAGDATLEWQQEINHAESGEILVRCVSRQQLRGLAEAGLTEAAVAGALR